MFVPRNVDSYELMKNFCVFGVPHSLFSVVLLAQAGFLVSVWALPLIWPAIQVSRNLRIFPKTQDLEFRISVIILLLKMRGHEF